MDDVHDKWPHRWVSPKVKAKSSAIEGVGAFATRLINTGEAVAILGGIIIHKTQLEAYHKTVGDFGIQIDDDFFICPSSKEELAQTAVFNHSCQPNIGIDEINPLKLVAMKTIKPGEEIVFDYAMTESICPAFECKCGSTQCRKIVTPNDWKSSELQKRYGNHFSPYLRSKFKKTTA